MKSLIRLQFFLLALFTGFLCAIAIPSLANSNHSQLPLISQVNPPNLEQQAKDLFDAGQYQEAIPLLQHAIQAYEQQGEPLSQAIALSNLALTYQEQGNVEAANQAIDQSLTILKLPSLPHTTDHLSALAQVLDIQGRLQLTQGQPEAALTIWQQAAQDYTRLNATDRLIRNQIDQSRALQAIGLYQRADELLANLTQTLAAQPPSLAKVAALRSIGDGLRMLGKLKESQEQLQASLTVAHQLQEAEDSPQVQEAIALINLSLGNTARVPQNSAEPDIAAAWRYYQQATAGSPTTRLQAYLNQLSLLVQTEQWNEAQTIVPVIQAQIEQLPLSQASIYAQINFADSLLQGNGHWQGQNSQETIVQAAQVLSRAAQQAADLQAPRAQAYALSKIGKLYEDEKQWASAEDLTRRALQLANTSVNAADITYICQWQLGRILKAKADVDIAPEQNKAEAIIAYREALRTLQTLRFDLVSANRDQQFSFRENVEPAYRQLIELLLESAPQDLSQQLAATDKILQANLVEARTTLESLQVAELQNFFRQACADMTVTIDQVVSNLNQQTQSKTRVAILYPIIRSNQLSVILKLTDRDFLHYSTTVSEEAVRDKLKQFRSELTQPETGITIKQTSKDLYDWLIQPAEKLLQESQIKTLVFVLDGYLKNVPMSALYDGEKYLVESYSIAITPGLQIPDPKPIRRERIRLLFAGMTQAVESEGRPFAGLPAIEQEATEIKKIIPDTEILLNDDFTSSSLESKVEAAPFQIVHLATHGEFSQDQDKTFILTFNSRIRVGQLDQILKTRDEAQPEPIELLVLSACQTAAGDERAALGLAGVAVRAGARSTLASLWSVDDTTTAYVMINFYRKLVDPSNISKAEAIQQTQQMVLKTPSYEHPYFWAPYVLVGNWL